MAIDVGTANTVVYVRGEGIVLAEPSVVAIETIDGSPRVLAVGTEAKSMMGRTPQNIKVVRPLRHGVISDIEVAEQMIKHFMAKARGDQPMLRGPDVVLCLPSGSTGVERRALRDAASNAGAKRVWFIEEAMAAAVGADLPVAHPIGSMVVDIGGGSTEVGVISLGGLNMSTSTRVGGDNMDEAITAHVRRSHNMLIGEPTAELIKLKLGTAKLEAKAKPKTTVVKGRDLANGVPAQITITQDEVAMAIADCVGQIVHAVRTTLEQVAPEISADIMGTGIILTGGGSLLAGIDTVIAEATGLPVTIAGDPLNCVALGAGRVLEDPAYEGLRQLA
jgi:rod shape-determining protein MreB